jgi:hypothetical protein
LPNKGFNSTSYTEISILENGNYLICDKERGNTISQNTYTSAEDVMFDFFYHTTSQMAQTFELQNRIDDQDTRRLKNQKHLDLINSLNPEWTIKAENAIELVLQQHPYNDGFVYKNILTVLSNFCSSFQMDNWLYTMKQSLTEWEQKKSTVTFLKASEKQLFLNETQLMDSNIEVRLLSMYLYWLKKGATSFGSSGYVAFPEYKKNLIWGRYCASCNTAQTNEAYINQNIAINLIASFFKKNLPYAEKLTACSIENIANSTDLKSLKKFLYDFFPSQMLEIIKPNQKMEKCIFCNKKNTISSWAIIKTSDNGHYLEVTT